MSDNGCASSCPESLRGVPTAPPARATADPPSPSPRPRRSRRRPPPASARRALLALIVAVAAGACRRGRAFAPPPRSRSSAALRLSPVAEPPARAPAPGPPAAPAAATTARATDFQRRMRGLVRPRGGRRAAGAAARPANLRTAHTLEEYKAVLDAEHEKIVVVRFFATWCKACKAIQPAYYRLASLHPGLIFLDVPVTNHNANLHQGLGVPSLPYGHVYYPRAGLVEELRISKKYFPDLVRRVRWYAAGECALDEGPAAPGPGGGA